MEREIKFRAYHKERKESSFVKWDNKTFKRGF